MEKRIAIKHILGALENAYSAVGYKGSLSRKWLIKETEQFNFVFKLFFYKYKSVYKVEPNIWIQSKLVEKIYRKFPFSDKVHNNYNAYTIGNNVGTLMEPANEDDVFVKNTTVSLSFNDNESLAETVGLLKYCIEKAAFWYFETYGNLQVIDSLLNDSPETPTIHSVIYPIRCAKGIIVAKLVKRPNYKQLVDFYADRLISLDTDVQFIDQFQKIKAYLENY